MNTDDRETPTSKPHLTTGPVDIGNERYLDIRLNELREKYSLERLSGLSARRLRGEAAGSERTSEEDELNIAFSLLRRQFPHSDYVGNENKMLQRVQRGDNYRGLSTLTIEQEQRIRDCKTECVRNLDRAMQEAVEAEQESSVLSRFGAWLTDFAEAATPLFGHWK